MARTGLSSPIQSSRYSGNSVLCLRSVPSMKRFIRSPANRVLIIPRESKQTARFHTGWIIRVGSDLSAFGAIAEMNTWGKVAMGQELPSAVVSIAQETVAVPDV